MSLTAQYNGTPDAVDSLVVAVAGADAQETEVDEPEAITALTEKATDQVIDMGDANDRLQSVVCTSFDAPELALPPALLKGLYEMNFTRPSKIQAASLPKIWDGRNLLAQSHNGTGKTACFVLGMLKVVSSEKKPQAICLCPTRELAKQIVEEVEKMGKYLLVEAGLTIKTVLKEERFERGDKITDQIVIGTPGKVWTLVNLKVCNPDGIRMFVLDEADDMLALGGLGDQTKRIRNKLPKELQILFFSATWTDEVKSFAKTLAALGKNNDWSQIEVKREFIFNDQVRQMYFKCNGKKEKEERIADILSTVTVGQCIIFVHTRESVETLCNKLKTNGHSVSMLHGRMEESNRDKVLLDFRANASRFLITTNVLSRGIDVPAVTLVIQYDMPVKKGGLPDPETYLHRVGRTGRFGKKGAALCMIDSTKEMTVLKKIETYFKRESLIVEIPGDTDPEAFEKFLTA